MAYRGKVTCLVGAFILLLAASGKSLAQEFPLIVESANKSGDAVGYVLSIVRHEAAKVDKPIIVIAYLGDGEVQRDLNRVRLNRVRQGIQIGTNRPGPKIILAEGGLIKGQGSVEIYVDGRLMAIIRSQRNRYLCASCCDRCVTVPAWARAKKK